LRVCLKRYGQGNKKRQCWPDEIVSHERLLS
jgi:hypothetical protein